MSIRLTCGPIPEKDQDRFVFRTIVEKEQCCFATRTMTGNVRSIRICMDECQKNCAQDELNEIVELFERQIYEVVQAQLAEDIVNTR